MKHFLTPLVLLLALHSTHCRRSRAISGKERGGVGISLPSISLWPWSRPTIGQRRQEQPDPRYNKLPFNKKPVAIKGVFTKKPTGLEKKPFGPKYPAKFVNSKYQKYQKPKPKLPPKNLRLAPIPDLRPTSIDRIDILRPQKLPQSPKVAVKKPQEFKVSPQTQRRQPQPVSKGVKTSPRVLPTKPEAQKLIDFNQKPIEVDGLKIFMFRGDEGIGGSGGFKPFIPPISDSLYRPYSPPAESLYKPYQVSPPVTPEIRDNQIRWSLAEISTPRSSQSLNDVPPPFPTRHTTPSPHQSDKPIVIIAQSNVAQN